MLDETAGGKHLCYYVMNNGVVEEQKAMFKRPNPRDDVPSETFVHKGKCRWDSSEQSVHRRRCNCQLDALNIVQEDEEMK